MALTQTNLRATFSNLLNISPNKFTVTIGGVDYDAIKTNLNKSIKYSDFGVESGYSFSIMLNVEDLPAIPVVDSICTISSTEYRIIGIEEDSSDVSVRLDLGQKYA